MNDIDVAVEQMINAIICSEEYIEYDVQRNKVKQYPELKVQIDEFRTRNFMLQNSADYRFEQIEALEKEYATFRENPLVSDFLAAELALCRLIQDIDSRLVEALHFE